MPEVCSWAPFASDSLLEEEIKRLIDQYGIQSAVETGTFLGVTAAGLAGMVPEVYTIEVRQDRYEQARESLAGLPNVKQFLGASADVLPELIPQIAKPALYYLDAHWDDRYPLPEEVAIIAEHDPSPVIVMHDMLVPGHHPELHADPQPDGSPYDFEWVRPGLEKIRSPWRHYYNARAEGLKIGIMFVVPA